jgi:hypothetical protein
MAWRSIEFFEMSRIPHFLDNGLRDGGEASYTSLPRFTRRKFSGTHFCSRLRNPMIIVWLEGLGKVIKFNDQVQGFRLTQHWFEYFIQ